MNPEPFRIEPMFVPRIWGARSLAPLYPEKSNLQEPIGEVWLTGVDCKVVSGPFTGKTFGEAWREMPPEWRGTRFTEPGDFPILIKFIFPNDKLSIQVHPDDAYAAAHEQAAGGRGKTEMWHVVSAEPGALVLVGLKPGATKEKFLRALQENTLEGLFVPHPVQAGDTFFVPAGTPHTIGPGMVLCEVQEYSDLTYRVYDYRRVDAQGKPRELHIEKALEVMKFGSRDGGKVNPLPLHAEGASRSLLAACRHFATERWECSVKCEIPVDPARFEVLVILDGTGSLAWPDSATRYLRGECWIVPASQGRVEVHPVTPTALVRSFVPDLAALRAELHRGGISAAVLSQIIFD
ncbi:MAG: mannose-6-phosphate isomerase [Acidobacteria bacterium]|nr:MAG: mannose-6-phosphate isomerase [Acidobacteriota bacterium]